MTNKTRLLLQGVRPVPPSLLTKSSPTDAQPFARRGLGALIAASAVALWPAALSAQTTPSLKDLIPDSAVDDPEGWATEDEPTEAQEPVDIADLPEIVDTADTGADLPDLAEVPNRQTPLDPFPEMSVQWPDTLDLPPVEMLPAEEDIQFADTSLLNEPDFNAAQVVRANDDVVLAFAADETAFPVRDELVSRFDSLSAIERLDEGEGNLAQIAARARADQALLDELLRVYGYYDSQIFRSLTPAETEGGDPTVRFNVVPGQRFIFGEVDLGQLHTAPDGGALRKVFGIETGEPLSNDRIVEQRLALILEMGETGYPFAKVGAPELEVDHADFTGDLSMPVAPNGKFTFGEVVSSDPDFLSGKHLGRIARFKPGEVYRDSLTADLRRAIIATGLVSSVKITPREATAPGPDGVGTVALDVGLTRAPLRTIAGAIGYGTEEGVRIQASWEHRNFFPPEGAFRVRGILGTREQLFGLTYRRNNFRARDRVLTLDAYASTLDSDAFDARTLAFVGSYEKLSTLLYQKEWSWSVGFEAIATSERPRQIGNNVLPRETYFVGALPASILYDTTNDLLDPVKGFRLAARLSPEVSRNNANWSNYVRSQVDGSYYRRINKKVVAATRFRMGTIPGTAIDNIAPSRRYYAGGGSSVRGFGYQQIGPRNTVGDPSGGRSLVELSAEARIRTGYFDGALAVVPFIDAGSVSSKVTPTFSNIKVGAGIGIRYYTNFGPIRVDVGVPLNPGPFDNPVGVYVSLGQAF